jgi:glycosyltransferase involved in cell wall biosynthesis
MKLLLSAHGAGLYGGERVLLALARGLAGRGHHIVLEIPHEGPALEPARSIPGIEVWMSGRPRLPRNVPELLRWLTGAAGARHALETRLGDGGFDALWVSSIYNAVAAWAGVRAGVPVVWHLHERDFRGPGGRAMARAVAAWSTVPVAVSAYVAASFEAHPILGGRVRVLPNALLQPAVPPLEKPDPGRSAFVVGCVGQLEPRKHATDVVAALALVPGVRGLIVGDGKARGRVLHSIARLGLTARIELAGFRPDPGPLYHEMSCVVIPSVREPFGLVALEAMAAGRPVIAARSGALPEVLGDAALLFEPGDVAALAGCIRRLRDEPGLAERLRRLGLERVRAFDPERWLDAAEALAGAAAGREVPV